MMGILLYAIAQMATVELTTLSDRLEDQELADLVAAYEDLGVGPLDIDDVAEQAVLDNGIDDDIFADFLDQLEANDAAADIYLPSDFEEVFVAGEHRIGSAHSLILVLENLRDDFAADEDDDNELEEDKDAGPGLGEDDEFFEGDDDNDPDGSSDESDGSVGMKEEQLRHVWRTLNQGAKAAIRRGLCLFIG